VGVNRLPAQVSRCVLLYSEIDNHLFLCISDEFDVFLDAVNRRISMKMMVSGLSIDPIWILRPPPQIDTANASDKKQYILITPLSVNVEIGKTVRIHRMSDPERNQGTLFAK
jgi:hypothetical protein